MLNDRYELDLTPETRAICVAYADGLNHYAALHKDEVLLGLFTLDGQDIVVGFVHRMLCMFNLDRVLNKLFSEDKPIFVEGEQEVGNNTSGDFSMVASYVIAVGPSRPADGFNRMPSILTDHGSFGNSEYSTPA